MESKALNDVFAALDKLVAAGPTPAAKLFTADDLASADVPFQLITHGAGGDVSIIPDERSNGIDAPAGVLCAVTTATVPVPVSSTSAVAEYATAERVLSRVVTQRYLNGTPTAHVPQPQFTAPFRATEASAIANTLAVEQWHESLFPIRSRVAAPPAPAAVGDAKSDGAAAVAVPAGTGTDSVAIVVPERLLYGDETVHTAVSAAHSTLTLVRHPLDGHVTGWDETPIAAGMTGTATSSQSMLRSSANRTDFVRGSIANLPFRPGGMDAPSAVPTPEQQARLDAAIDLKNLFPWDKPDGVLFTSAPGLPRGMRLPAYEAIAAKAAAAHAAAVKLEQTAAAAVLAATNLNARSTGSSGGKDVKSPPPGFAPHPVAGNVKAAAAAAAAGKTKYQLFKERLAAEKEKRDADAAANGEDGDGDEGEGEGEDSATAAGDEKSAPKDASAMAAAAAVANWDIKLPAHEAANAGLYKVGVNPSGLLRDNLVIAKEEEEFLAAAAVERKRERARAAAARAGANSNANSVKITEVVAEMADLVDIASDDDDDSKSDRKSKSRAFDAGGEKLDERKAAKEAETNEILDELLAGAEKFGAQLKGFAALPKKKALASRKVWAETSRLNVSDFHRSVPHPAIQYPFELDDFQKKAVMHLEKGESVFVAAHTSAGKTVVAEYAIALAMKHLTRAVYTSPIKTLSNQKFREFRKTFGESDVGVITGDVQINPEASCLILTTEILRSMLYKGADLIRDIEWVIFDEVHYVADLERGVVWEEVIIMLPAHVGLILLSATVHNVEEFADWVGRTKKRKVHVMFTDKRPVPLQHHLWCKNKLFTINDTRGWQSDGFKQARLEGETDKDREKKKAVVALGRGSGYMKQPKFTSEKNQWINLVNYLKKRELLPVAVFYFSKKKCEESAFSMGSLDLTTNAEKSEIHIFVDAALNRLQPVDRKLPQVTRVKDLLKKGVGVHHAGILPILKEVVEMVFQRGLVKVLFATETFAMGVNMPTKTVVFSNLRKHDGNDFRNLLPGEYTQMAGRAGRRGLDSFGYVVINCKNDEVPDEATIKGIVTGRPSRLESRFRLSYNMILNLLRQEDMKVEDMIKRSFSEWATQKEEPEKKKFLRAGESKLRSMERIDCKHHTFDELEEYFHNHHTLEEMQHHVMRLAMTDVKAADRLLGVGRMILVSKYEWPTPAFAVMLQTKATEKKFIAFILCPAGCQPPKRLQALKPSATSFPQIGLAGNGLTYILDEIRPIDVTGILSIKPMDEKQVRGVLLDKHISIITAVARELAAMTDKYGNAWEAPTATAAAASSPVASAAAATAASGTAAAVPQQELTKRIAIEKVPLLAPESEIKISDLNLADALGRRAEYTQCLVSSPVHTCPYIHSHVIQLRKQSTLSLRLQQIKQQLAAENANTELLADFETRLVVLERLQYIAGTDRSIQLKGRVACEVNTCDSLIVTELIFENVFVGLTPPEIVSLLSCLIFHEKDAQAPVLTERMKKAHTRLTEITTSLANIQRRCELDIIPAEYLRDNVNPGMMQVVYEWARGTTFAEICTLTNILEGSIVRCITRLDETCRDVRNAARVIGDPQLFQNMVVASEIIKRDIVFAASLYTQ